MHAYADTSPMPSSFDNFCVHGSQGHGSAEVCTRACSLSLEGEIQERGLIGSTRSPGATGQGFTGNQVP